MTDEAKAVFNVGDHVETIKGANFRGRIIGLYEDAETGTPGAVVQATLEAYKGVKHVYPLAQLKLMFPAEYDPAPTYVQHMGRLIRSTIKSARLPTDAEKHNAITDADNREFVATVLKMLDTKEKWDALERIAKLQAKKPGAPWSLDAKATEKLYADVKAGNTAEFETQRTLARTEGIETLVDKLVDEASKLGMYQCDDTPEYIDARAKLVMANTKLAQSLDKMHAEYDKFAVKYDRMKAELAAVKNEAGAFENAAQNYRAERDAMRQSINKQADALRKIKDALNPPSNTA